MTKQALALVAALVLGASALSPCDAAAAETLRLQGRTELASYHGDFDHFAADVKGNRLFLAGEDGGTLEVFNLHTGAHIKTVPGMETPHAISVCVPPSSFQSGSCFCLASASHNAFSRAALAMLWPRTLEISGAASLACAICFPTSAETRKSRSVAQAVSIHS